MNINDVRILKKPLVLADVGEVDALESKLWLAFPSGYREYVTKSLCFRVTAKKRS
jgi:hypothetical protein